MTILLGFILIFLILIFFVSAADSRINNIFYMPRPPIIKAASNKKLMTPRSSLVFFFARFKSRLNISSVINGFFISFIIYGFAVLVHGLLTGTNLTYCTVYVNNIFYFLISFLQSLFYKDNFFFLSVFITVFFCNIIVLSSVGKYFFKHFPGIMTYALVLNTGLLGLVVATSLYDVITILIHCARITLQSRALSFPLLELLQFFDLLAFNELQSLVPTQLLYDFVFILVLASLLFLQYTRFIDENYKELDMLILIGFTKGIRLLISVAWVLPLTVLWFADGLWFGQLLSILCMGFIILSTVYRMTLFITFRYSAHSAIFSTPLLNMVFITFLVLMSSIGLSEIISTGSNLTWAFNKLPILASRTEAMRLTVSLSNFEVLYQQVDLALSYLNSTSQFDNRVKSLVGDLFGWLVNDHMVLLDYTANGGWISKDLIDSENYIISDSGSHRPLPEHELVFQTPKETSGDPSLALLWSDSHLYGTFYVRVGRANALHWKSIYWLALDSHSNAVISPSAHQGVSLRSFYIPGIPWSLGTSPVRDQSIIPTAFATNTLHLNQANPGGISYNLLGDTTQIQNNMSLRSGLDHNELSILAKKIDSIRVQISKLTWSVKDLEAKLEDPNCIATLDSVINKRSQVFVERSKASILNLEKKIYSNNCLIADIKNQLKNLYSERSYALADALSEVLTAKNPVIANLQKCESLKLDWLLTQDWAARRGSYEGSLFQEQEQRLVDLSKDSEAYMNKHSVAEKRSALKSLLASSTQLEQDISSNDNVVERSSELLGIADKLRALHAEVRHHNLTLESFQHRHDIVRTTTHNFKVRLPVWKDQYTAASPSQKLKIEALIKTLQEEAHFLREVYDNKKALLADCRDRYFIKEKGLLTELHTNATECARLNIQKNTIQTELANFVRVPQGFNFLSKNLEALKKTLNAKLIQLADYTRRMDQSQTSPATPRDNFLLAKRDVVISKKNGINETEFRQIQLRIHQISKKLSTDNIKFNNLTKTRAELLNKQKTHRAEVEEFNSYNLRHELLKAKNTQELSKVTQELRSNLDELEALEKGGPSTIDSVVEAEQNKLESLVAKLSNLFYVRQKLEDERQAYALQVQAWSEKMRLHAGRLAIIRAAEQQGNDKLQILQKEADTYATKYKIANLQLVHSRSPAMLTDLYAHLQDREHKFQVLQTRVDTVNFLIATYRHDAPERGLRNLHDELFSIRKEMQSRSRALAHYKANISRVEARAEFVQQEINRFMPGYNDYFSQIASEKKALELKLQRLWNSNLVVPDQEALAEETRLHHLKVRLDDENSRINADERNLVAERDNTQQRLVELAQSRGASRQEAIALRTAVCNELELRHKNLTEEKLVLDTSSFSRSVKKLHLEQQSLNLQAELRSFDEIWIDLQNNISRAESELQKLLRTKNNLLSVPKVSKTGSKPPVVVEGALTQQFELGDQFFDKPTYPIFTGDPYEVLDDFIKGKKFVSEPVLPGRTQPSIFTTQKVDGFNTSSRVSTISPQKHPFNSVTGHMQDELLEFINAHWPYAGLSGVSSCSIPLPAIFDFNTSTYIEPINKWLSVTFSGSLLFTGWSFFPYGDYILLFLKAMSKLFYSKPGLVVSCVSKYYITDFIPNSVINYNRNFWTLAKLFLYYICDFKTTFFPNIIGAHRVKRTVYPLTVRLAWVSLGQSGLIMLIIFLGLFVSPFLLTPVSGYKGSIAATRIVQHREPYQPLWSLVARSRSGFFFGQFFLLWFFVFMLRILLLLSFNMLAGFTLAEWSAFSWKHDVRQKLPRAAELHFAEAWSGYTALKTQFLFNNSNDLAARTTSRTRLHRQLLRAIRLHRDPSSRPRAANRKEAKKAAFKTFLRRYYSLRSLYFAHFDSRAELTRLYLRDWSSQQLGYGQPVLQPNPILSTITPLEYAALNPINQRITRLNYILARSGLSFTSPASLESIYAQTPLGAVRRGKSRKTAGIDALNKLGTFASVDAEGFAMRPAFKSRLWVKFHSTHRLGSQSRRLLSPVIDITGPRGGLVNRLSQTVVPQSFSCNQQNHPRVLHNFNVASGRSSYYGFFNSIVGSDLNEKYFEEGVIFKKPKRTKGLTLYNEDRSNFTRQTNVMHRFFVHRRFRAPRYGANLRNFYAKGPFKYSFSLRQHYGRHYLRRGERLTFSSWFTDRLLMNNFYSVNFMPLKYGPVVITQHWPARFFNLFYTPQTMVIRPHFHDTDVISSSGTDLISVARGHPPNRQFRTRGQSLVNRSKLANKPLSKTPSIFTIPLIEDRYLQGLDAAQVRIILRRLSVLEAHYSVELASLLHGRKGSVQHFHSADAVLHRASINTRTHAKWLAWSADAHTELLRARVRTRKTKKLTATIAEWCHPLLPKTQGSSSVSFDKKPFTITNLVPLVVADEELLITFRLLKKNCLEPSIVFITKVGSIMSTENLVNMGFGITTGVLTLALAGFYL